MKQENPRFRWVAAAFAGAAILIASAAAYADPPLPPDLNPIIFVHGGSGSGAQFETQAWRFTSNGYPIEYIRVLEYDSSQINAILPAVHAELDALIAELQAATGRPQVDLLGHSLGTFVSQTYLATPARAANVAHYVNIDGGSAAAPPGGVPTLALWAGADPPVGSIVGALNVTLAGQEHVESATSADAFFEMFQFFRGAPPETTAVVPEAPGHVRISGQVNFFPSNVGITGAFLEIWEVDPATGLRVKKKPEAAALIDATGDWGPIKVHGFKSYEFAVARDGEVDVNFFYEPFLRSDHLIRLNIATGLVPFIDSSPNHTALTVVRQREFCGDLGAGSDVLEIGGTNVINTSTASCASIALGSAAVFAFDDGSDGVSNVSTVPFPFGPLAFLTATDLFIPTAPAGTVSVVTVPRGGGAPRTVNVPNLPSSQSRVVVNLYDFEP
ncbi:MAG TPA: alpha/beta fold hydrolase [Myxococcota bacterium]|jgi:pimeloyl-ACP methyl ester carboxylesterase